MSGNLSGSMATENTDVIESEVQTAACTDRQDTENAEDIRRLPPLDESIRFILENPGLSQEQKCTAVVSRIVRSKFGDYRMAAGSPEEVEAALREFASSHDLTFEDLVATFHAGLDKFSRMVPSERPGIQVKLQGRTAADRKDTTSSNRRDHGQNRDDVETRKDLEEDPDDELQVESEPAHRVPRKKISRTESVRAETHSATAKVRSSARVKHVDVAFADASTAPGPVAQASGVPPKPATTASGGDSVSLVPIDSIVVGPNHRKLHDVSALMQSISDVGLLNPICLTREHVLVAGLHRLEACRRLDWTEIRVVFVDHDDLHLELTRIDENLVRTDLTALERAEQVARRQEIYESLHPRAKHGGAAGRKGGGKVARTKAETVSSFARDTAKRIGTSDRSVQQDCQIAAKVPQEVRDAIRETPLADRKRDLLSLARLEPEVQLKVVDLFVSGRAKTFGEAKRTFLAGTTEQKAQRSTSSKTTSRDRESPQGQSETPSEASQASTPQLPPGLSDEALAALEDLRAIRGDPSMSCVEKLFSLGEFVKDSSLGVVSPKPGGGYTLKHDGLTKISAMTGYSPKDVSWGIFIVEVTRGDPMKLSTPLEIGVGDDSEWTYLSCEERP